MEAIDRDAGENGRVTYTILSGNLNDTFDIDRSTGALFTSREVRANTDGGDADVGMTDGVTVVLMGRDMLMVSFTHTDTVILIRMKVKYAS